MSKKNDDVEIYLDYIKGLGIEAWIPDSTEGYGPKMSVADQCRSKVLCLNYNDTDIYIQGKVTSESSTNKQDGVMSMCPVTTESTKSICNLKNRSTANQLNKNNFIETGISMPSTVSASSVVAEKILKCSVGVQWNINDSLDTGKISCREPSSTTKTVEKTIKKIDHIKKEHFALDVGVHYRRIVREKLTREVRVARQYVSSLTNHNHGNSSMLKSDKSGLESGCSTSSYKGPAEVKKSWPARGNVRQLVETFHVNANLGK